jgi:hypothetical protein
VKRSKARRGGCVLPPTQGFQKDIPAKGDDRREVRNVITLTRRQFLGAAAAAQDRPASEPATAPVSTAIALEVCSSLFFLKCFISGAKQRRVRHRGFLGSRLLPYPFPAKQAGRMCLGSSGLLVLPR